MRHKIYDLTVAIQYYIWRKLVFKNNIGPSGEKPGDRIQLKFTDDQYTTLKPGAKGTVNFVDDYGTVHINWDEGSQLGLVPHYDEWFVISK